jgi:anti-sigma factor RsiW
LADLHVTTLASANPVDVISSDRHTVKPWFQGRLPFSFNLPDLAGTPFQLIGGRVAWLRQNPGAHLLFQIREHRISAFIFQERPEWGRAGAAPFPCDSWTQGGLRYFLIGDANPSDLRQLRLLWGRPPGLRTDPQVGPPAAGR